MKVSAFVIFYAIVLSIYGLVNFYIYSRGINSLPPDSKVRPWFIGVFLFLSLSFVAGRILERYNQSLITDVFVWAGSFWLAIMFYILLVILAIDLVRLANWAFPFFPETWNAQPGGFRQKLMFFVGGSVILLVLAGHINTLFPRTRNIDLEIPTANAKEGVVRMAMVSDIHLGTIIGPRRLTKLVETLNHIAPDIIVMAGDVVDEDLKPVIRNNAGAYLKRLNAPYGVYGITGNHEYIGGAEKAVEYLSKNGISILRDSVVKINNSFYLIGRDDLQSERFGGKARKPLEQLLSNLDPELPVFLLDHQPYHPEKNASLGINLQMSGHTHHGQIWPLNYITSLIFPVSYGYSWIDGMHLYVSNGFGTWGPPVRIGNKPEIVVFNIRFIPMEKLN